MTDNTPVRLHKQKTGGNYFEQLTSSAKDKWSGWINQHPLLILTLFILLFSLLFIALCFLITGHSATESGNVYNHFKEVI